MDDDLQLKALQILACDEHYLESRSEFLNIKDMLKTDLDLYQISYLWGMYSFDNCFFNLIPCSREIENFKKWIKNKRQ